MAHAQAVQPQQGLPLDTEVASRVARAEAALKSDPPTKKMIVMEVAPSDLRRIQAALRYTEGMASENTEDVRLSYRLGTEYPIVVTPEEGERIVQALRRTQGMASELRDHTDLAADFEETYLGGSSAPNPTGVVLGSFPRFAQHYSHEQVEITIDWLKERPLNDLRMRHDIHRQQAEIAKSIGDTDIMLSEQHKYDMVTDAISRQSFGRPQDGLHTHNPR